MPWTQRMRFVLAAEAGEEPMAARVPAVRDQPAARVPVAGALARGRRSRARRAVAGAARSSAGGGARAPRGLSRRAARASDLGAGEGAGVRSSGGARASAAWPAASTIGALFDRRGADGEAPAPAAGAARRAALRGRRRQRRLDHRLQGLVQDRRRRPRRPADARATPAAATSCAARRWRAPTPSTSGRSSTPPSASTGCRSALRSDNGPPFATIGAGGLSRLAVMVIKAGVTPRAHRPRQAAGERPPRADAPDAAPGHRQPAGGHPAGAGRSGSGRSGRPTTRSGRTPPSATRRRPSATPPRRGAGTACLRAPETVADEVPRG